MNIVIDSCLYNENYFRWEEQILVEESNIGLPEPIFKNDIDIFSY